MHIWPQICSFPSFPPVSFDKQSLPRANVGTFVKYLHGALSTEASVE